MLKMFCIATDTDLIGSTFDFVVMSWNLQKGAFAHHRPQLCDRISACFQLWWTQLRAVQWLCVFLLCHASTIPCMQAQVHTPASADRLAKRKKKVMPSRPLEVCYQSEQRFGISGGLPSSVGLRPSLRHEVSQICGGRAEVHPNPQKLKKRPSHLSSHCSDQCGPERHMKARVPHTGARNTQCRPPRGNYIKTSLSAATVYRSPTCGAHYCRLQPFVTSGPTAQ